MIKIRFATPVHQRHSLTDVVKFKGVGSKLKMRGPNSGAKIFPLPPLLFWALHFNFS